MIDYAEFDALLREEIAAGKSQFYQLQRGELLQRANSLAIPDRRGERAGGRVIDRRLQALRKRGVIAFDGKMGWRAVVAPAPRSR